MAIAKTEKQYSPSAGDYIYQYILDSEADAANLPKAAPGSMAIVAKKDGPMYMVNASGEWEEF